MINRQNLDTSTQPSNGNEEGEEQTKKEAQNNEAN